MVFQGSCGNEGTFTLTVCTFPFGPERPYSKQLYALSISVSTNSDSYTVTGAIAPGVRSTGSVRAQVRESAADIVLKGVAVPMGFTLGVGKIKRKEIRNLIRSMVCNPSQ